ncbi:XdhC family aldehyde oxidoreductase maturation factor [Desulfotomaculum copahuensis]|uniref:Dehydrogenase n=1 Tax=Desulfotomaculum copahuensis TaxID=1838280 RepID=A0A1B7LHK0_9FIRM|nr:XdhC/CoxI family protein [Desulfotomaculum copahuensis]OAT85776.1 dehydrogenase [Desulfotomaculum copahuensis]
MKGLFDTCTRLLAGGEDVVTATIISRSGSAPRTAGTKMLVRRDGSFAGTIGGGLLEALVLEQAREVFQTGQAVIREFNLTGADAAGMDMICGGRLEVFVDFLSAGDPVNVEIFRTVSDLLRTGQRALLVTGLPSHAGDGARFNRCLLLKDGRQTGCSPDAGLAERLSPVFKSRYPQLVLLNEANFIAEPVNSPGTVYLFGAGHVAQQVARLTAMVDFRTVVLDDREEFANRQRFPLADEIIVPEDFNRCLKDLPISGDSYLVIVTRGHRYDLTVLAQALQTGACYIGMIGSRRKRDAIYRALRETGVTEEQLSGVHSPIGLSIEAETPEEIAVSIVAELIKVRGKLMYGQL